MFYSITKDRKRRMNEVNLLLRGRLLMVVGADHHLASIFSIQSRSGLT